MSCLIPEGEATDIRKTFLIAMPMSHQNKLQGRWGRLSSTGKPICDKNGSVMALVTGGEWLKRLCQLQRDCHCLGHFCGAGWGCDRGPAT